MHRYINLILLTLVIVLTSYTLRVSEQPHTVLVSPPDMLIGRVLEKEEQVPAIVALLTASGAWEEFLKTLEQHHNVVVIWNGPGGWLVIEREVVNRVQQLQKRQNIVFIVTERAVSAQAFSLCYFDNVKVLPQAEVMFHQGITMDGNKSETERENEQCIKSGLMTPMDVAQMVDNNQEVHVTFDEDGKRHVRYEDDPRFIKPKLLNINTP